MHFNVIHENLNHIANFMVLIVKQYIYKSRCAGIPPTGWIEAIDDIHDIEIVKSMLKN